MRPSAVVVFCLFVSPHLAGGVPDDDGFIRDWVILGPLDWGCSAACAAPGAVAIETDYLAGTVDGEAVDEVNIEPVAGMEVVLGASVSVLPTAANLNPNQPGAAAWFSYTSNQSLLDFNVAFGGDPGDDYMVYAVTYIENTTGAPIDVNIALTSDDSVELYLRGESVWVNNVARGVDLANLDVVPLLRLEPGINRFLSKVFEGDGGTGFALRFEDPFTGEPLTGDDGLSVRLTPEGQVERPGILFRRGDADGNGVLDVTDPIRALVLEFIAAHLPPSLLPPCLDALDFDDNGRLEITDPINSLFHQFLGGDPPAAPGLVCGIDPTPDDANLVRPPGEPDDELGCEAYPNPDLDPAQVLDCAGN